MTDIFAVIRETNGDGAGRIVEATGYPPLVNNSFSLLRYVTSYWLCLCLYDAT